MSRFGLPHADIETITRILRDHPAVDRAIVYGSRAIGRHRPGSDLDLVLVGESLTLDELGAIAGELEDSEIPCTVDLTLWHRIDHAPLREHVERVGQDFYRKS